MRLLDRTINGTRFRVTKLHDFAEEPFRNLVSCEIEVSRDADRVTAKASSIEVGFAPGPAVVRLAFYRARRYIAGRQARAWAGVE